MYRVLGLGRVLGFRVYRVEVVGSGLGLRRCRGIEGFRGF